ncbi:hypothetical protein PGH07_03060 [Sulfurovum sp. zt1-1]|uniref:Cytochrome C n=1 Tax=Sulfurovum zhangzhouensis TaxID=3019067 RepID=A0ABT7QWC1_9BACT|nr:hypothetical protein [Sulfurovum zhangzhouensis]MDM5271145.1 hypothetical protein [Sulfurovum zhangzhouensis]
MKKILVIGVLSTTLMFGAGVSKAEQVITMQGLESAMGMIQKGFLRDNPAIMKLGVESLKEKLVSINSFVIEKSVMDGDNFDAKQYAQKEVKNITNLADKMLKDFEAGDKASARETYDKTLSQCMACHTTIRK